MKVIIAGSRRLNADYYLARAIEGCGFDITEVVTGMGGNVDKAGATWAALNGIPVKEFPARWSDTSLPDAIIRLHPVTGQAYDAKAGPRRNEEMVKYADALIAIWDGYSRGTDGIIDLAQKHGLPTYVINTVTSVISRTPAKEGKR